MILVPGQAERGRFEELGALVPHHILYPPHCPGLGRLGLVHKQLMSSDHLPPHVGVSGGLLDGGHQVLRVEAGPVQHHSVAPPLRPHHVGLLVVTQRYPHQGGGVVQTLLQTEGRQLNKKKPCQVGLLIIAQN